MLLSHRYAGASSSWLVRTSPLVPYGRTNENELRLRRIPQPLCYRVARCCQASCSRVALRNSTLAVHDLRETSAIPPAHWQKPQENKPPAGLAVSSASIATAAASLVGSALSAAVDASSFVSGTTGFVSGRA